MSPCTSPTGVSPAPTRARALCRVHAKAAGSRSTAVTRAPGCSWAIDSAMAPDPLPRSTTRAPSRPVPRPGPPPGERLGPRPGHEDTRPDGQLEEAEGGAAGEVLEGHPVGALL